MIVMIPDEKNLICNCPLMPIMSFSCHLHFNLRLSMNLIELRKKLQLLKKKVFAKTCNQHVISSHNMTALSSRMISRRIVKTINSGYFPCVPPNCSDQYVISPYSFSALLSRVVGRVKKTIN